jgi:alpha-L-fucosidase
MLKQLFPPFLLLLFITATAQPLPHPSPAQLRWQEMKYYWFLHFGPNTFTGSEWGKGNEKEEVFNPTQLDCRQWCRLAKAAGAKGLIITAKHHDGFCLWPSKYSTHTVRESKWKNGKGDVLKELSVACKEYGLKFGVYLSPWDRNHPDYGTPAYNDVFVNMLKEIFSSYGPIWELWWDGANGEGSNGKKQVYDWHRFEATIRKLSPQTIIFSDIGPDCRWVGNEQGIAGITNWGNLDTAGFKRGEGAPPPDSLTFGNVNGSHWIPAECDVSIRPGWFYHKEENQKVKSPGQLFDLYLKSVGRGANLLLNVPPNDRGLISSYDSTAVIQFKKLVDASFAKSIEEKKFTSRATFYKLPLKQAATINSIWLKEGLKKGQRISAFTVLLKYHSTIVKLVPGTTIGTHRIITFPSCKIDEIEVKINSSKAKPLFSRLAVYSIPGELIENNK